MTAPRRSLAEAAAEARVVAAAEPPVVAEGWGFVDTIDRRDFMRLTATGLLITFSVKPLKGMPRPVWNPANLQRPSPDFNAFVHIGADNRVTVLVGKIEMGQGVMTSLPQMAAEELNVDIRQVDVVMGDTDLCPFDMGTYGSLSTRTLGPVLRAAAAEGRAVLVQMASERLGVPVERLEVVDGVVRSKADHSKRVSYGELTAGRRIERKYDGTPALEKVGDFTIMGISAPRRDAPEKVTGKAHYAGDVIPKGALHARLLRPPAHGAIMKSADTSAAEKYPGARVVRVEGGPLGQVWDAIAVLHAHHDEADKALKLVKAEWRPSESTLDDKNIFAHLEKAAPPGRPSQSGGDVATGEKNAASTIAAKYLKGYVAHAPMETHSAVAEVAPDGKVTVWAGTQTPFPLQTQVARALKLPPEKVRVITPYVGGGFGGKSASQQAIEAAVLAQAAGVPVRVVWDRTEEIFYDTFDPATVINIRSGLTAQNKIAFWDYEVIAAGGRGAEQFYDIPHHRTVVRGSWGGGNGDLHPFAVGPWRAPGANANCFARESHVDQLAAKAGMDPVAFRMANFASDDTGARIKRTLEAAAKQFGWTGRAKGKASAAGEVVGYGVACGIDAGTAVSGIAEVHVNRATGAVKVVRVAVAQDMGIVVNPTGAMQQLEGCITQGLGYVLSEEIRFRNGEILDKNFTSYTLPHFSWVPKIEGVLVENNALAPQGGGEPAIILMGAMIANGIFDATGRRMVQLPFTPARVKAALA
ncbi:MAG TPA: molybdopterin cofactor-binding domain-containing protein [Gemmatimonadaceae bacterium]|nr:molybdopterin cofactor-binding domain-containing protein [Gemmatimonadaceae bacterium]